MNIKKKFPYGVCECSGGLLGGCCQGYGPAAFEVIRDGKKMILCTRCDFSTDKEKKLLVKKTDSPKPFMDFDALGGFCIIGMLAED